MSSLYIDRRGLQITLEHDALVLFENGQRSGTIPLHPLSRVFIRGGVTVDSAVLARLGEAGIGVVLLSGRRHRPTLLLPRPHNDAARRVRQYAASLDPVFCLAFAQHLIEHKLARQLDFLSLQRERQPQARYPLTQAIGHIAAMREQICSKANLAQLRGLEGAAANSYFTAFAALVAPSLGFQGRNRRPPRDPMNAVLSLGYTLLHAEGVLCGYGAGLDPAIGFYHQLDFGRESLVCDLIEPLRAEVDAFALHLFRQRELRLEDFSHTAEGCLLGKAGRVRFYQAWERIAGSLRRGLEQQIDQTLEQMETACPTISLSTTSPIIGDADASAAT